jgi:hypothetical protein
VAFSREQKQKIYVQDLLQQDSAKIWKLLTEVIYIYIYVYYRKIYNLFVRALETGRKVSFLQAFLICFAMSANKFYI